MSVAAPDREMVTKLRSSGFKPDEIAEMTGLTTEEVRKHLSGLDKAGIDKRKYAVIAARTKQVMYGEKEPGAVRIVAEEYGLSSDHVRYICKREGVELRGHLIADAKKRQRKEEIIALCKEGWTYVAIGDRYQIAARTVRNLVGAQADQKVLSEAKRIRSERLAAEVVRLRKEGMPIVKIREKLKISFERLYNALEAAGMIHASVSADKEARMERNLRIIEAYDQGVKVAEISKQVGLTTQGVYGVIRRNRREVEA